MPTVNPHISPAMSVVLVAASGGASIARAGQLEEYDLHRRRYIRAREQNEVLEFMKISPSTPAAEQK